MKLTTSQEMKSLDQTAIEEYEIPGVVLMENAALKAVGILREKYDYLLSHKVFVFCGKGNNGGDGFAIARHLENLGHTVEILLLAGQEKVKGDADVNLQIVRKMKISVRSVTTREELHSLHDRISGQGLIVDAIFGTGLTSAVTGFYEEAIGYINSLPNPVFSVDIPSGLNADTGKVDGSCIRADVTVTFALPKIAHFITPASVFCGRLEVVDISIPAELIDKLDSGVETMEARDIATMLRPQAIDSHKGNFGHLLVIGGSEGMGGAPAMAAMAGLRSGTGLVTLAVPEKIHQTVEIGLMEVMSLSLPESGDGSIGEGAYQKLEPFLQSKNAVVVGPGMGTHRITGEFLEKIIGNVSCPLLIDADGLNLLAVNKSALKNKKGPIVLTPHPGEMARLLNITAKEVQMHRLETAGELAETTGCTIVLKGAGSIIASPKGKFYVNTTGNPGMATAGTGDVLSGIVGGLLAQGHEPEKAAKMGVFLHGLAGDIVAEKLGERPLIAGDLIQAIPKAFQTL